MTDIELASLYNTTDRNIRRWKVKRAPLDRPDEMAAWIASQRSRRLVSKTRTKAEADAPVPITLPTVPAHPVNLEPVELGEMPSTELGRAEHLEKIAARIAESGDAKAIDAWSKASAERRRIASEIRETASAITEGDMILAKAVSSVFEAMLIHFEKLPGQLVLWMMGAEPETCRLWEPKIAELIEKIIGNAILECHLAVRGTPLQSLFAGLVPEELEAEFAQTDNKRKDFLARPINERQADTCTL